MSWKLAVTAPRLAVEAALARQEMDADWDPDLVVTGFEVDPKEPEIWQLDAYCPGKPSQRQRNAVKALFDDPAPQIRAEELPDADWVSESQKGMDPIRAGRFFVHTPDHPAHAEKGVRSFCIPAAQAFGTGQHATTAGCLVMLDAMKRRGVVVRNLADIGTGTGLLAFAAMHLWPRARATASDIDPVCLPAVCDNAELNGVPLGTGRGELAMVIAEGMDDGLIQQRAPYDLLIANILAGPLIDLSPSFAAAMAPRSHIVLSGLLTTQEAAVRRAYRKVGFRLQARLTNGDWSILWLRQRYLF
ncbi:50S ribosomal protein L11 methyltransferase [Altererythrobacter lauratis]|uniref:Ribosomal protein L11 methyltransferase n=1 Tax=Alteraurantiacibacter lauratis TaxID=2054627 RepID=A0ABV7EBS0_9SPHN